MIKLDHCSVEWTERGALVTFADGCSTEAYPHPGEPHYSVIAHRCGYGDDLMAYCREHELAHCVVYEAVGGPSPVLWWQARGQSIEPLLAAAEEIAVQTFQRWCRANERPIVGGVDWDGLKAKFLALADHLNKEHSNG